MPELPEVETIARQLRELVIGRRIAGFESFWHRVTEPVPASHFATRLSGREITAVGRRGKFVVLELDGGEALIVSLRMTGSGCSESTTRRRHVRSCGHRFADGTFLRFSDPRSSAHGVVDRGISLRTASTSRRAAGRRFTASLDRPLSRALTTRWLASFLQRRGGPRSPLLRISGNRRRGQHL